MCKLTDHPDFENFDENIRINAKEFLRTYYKNFNTSTKPQLTSENDIIELDPKLSKFEKMMHMNQENGPDDKEVDEGESIDSKFEDELIRFDCLKNVKTGPNLWLEINTSFGILNLCFCQLKSIIVSNASIERMFSDSKNLFSHLKSNMSTQTLESRLVNNNKHP